ncbi:hypothetical protein KSP39_PZI019622 [Platanthera zijinensis]|uniref:Protein FAR1-RELATED SEQUENCE n=1 Tax=Platanthera zijinensis TaxID=2320716 RepID=A0AAP0B137_9ASPA
MLSTQRSESTNNVCHSITKATSTLVDCFLQLEKMIMKAREKVLEEDFKCKQASLPVNAKNCPILKQVSKIYTRVMYEKFYEEFKHGLYIVEELPFSDHCKIFTLRWSDCGENNKHWYVQLDCSNYDVSCSCKKFETSGMLCCHALKVYTHTNITFISDKYIPKRWTLDARKDTYLHLGSCSCQEFSSTVSFRNNVSRFSYDVAVRAEKCNEARNYVMDALREISTHVDAITEADCNLENVSMGKPTVIDPPKLRPKGVSNARLKSFWEKKGTLFKSL